jgi:hypothetical protein
VAGEQVLADLPDGARGDALAQVLLEAQVGVRLHDVGVEPLLAAGAHLDHVLLGEALPGVLVDEARDPRADLRAHHLLAVQVPREDRPGVAVQERVVHVEDGGRAAERDHAAVDLSRGVRERPL